MNGLSAPDLAVAEILTENDPAQLLLWVSRAWVLANKNESVTENHASFQQQRPLPLPPLLAMADGQIGRNGLSAQPPADEECENESEDAEKQLDSIEIVSDEIVNQKLATSSHGAQLHPPRLQLPPLLLLSGLTGRSGHSVPRLAVMER